MLRSFLIAFQFLTRIPLSFNSKPQQGDLGRSLLFYPLVGLLIGTVLVITAKLTTDVNQLLSSALIVSVWVIITGGLHLDGLADTVDAWIGGMDSKERTLEIMKDSAAGPMGVLGLILLILLKTSAVYALLSSQVIYYLIIAPVLGRTLAIILMAVTPYIREKGLGSTLARELNTDKIWMVSVGTVVLLVAIKMALGISLILCCATLLVLWRHQLLKRLGGCTGDTIGALIEVAECSTLIIIALY